MTRLSLLLATAAIAAASVATAQTRHDSSAPINFGADHIELQDKAHRTILAGNVSVKQAEMTLNAARVTVSYRGEIAGGPSPEAQRIDASGGVIVTRPDQSARGQYAVYDLNKRVITMLGGVTLIQAGNTVNGSRLTITLDTGRAVIDGSGVRGSAPGTAGTTSSGGRVTGTFSVPKRN
ncbi:MAG: OstA family protein [Sphingomonas bacterium]|uniref:LptA/OstA family protein n=1 Tax=Sphingomonas bacterium TaxID=1895847 RepID=UPI00261F479C|nr:LptA/OstA family protein [Sphingomonas bacterium]MDB5708012.1 OstA family protein [Sphingomonas bacterium]